MTALTGVMFMRKLSWTNVFLEKKKTKKTKQNYNDKAQRETESGLNQKGH